MATQFWQRYRRTGSGGGIHKARRWKPPTLERLEDRLAPATFTVTNTTDCSILGCGSLRRAIMDANSSGGPHLISFNVGGGGVQTISPTSALPTLDQPVTIDGTTQPGFSGTPIIELDGNMAGNASGLLVGTSDTTIRGLVINRWSKWGIESFGPTSNITIVGNYIGTDVSGSVARPNGASSSSFNGGVFTNVFSNGFWQIGGTSPADRNVISGNRRYEVFVSSYPNGQARVQGNYIGTDATGMYGLPSPGVEVQGPGALIGGTAAGAGNVISRGMILNPFASGVTVQGNFFGTNAAGTAQIDSGGITVSKGANGNLIGGGAPGARNIVSGYSEFGIDLHSDANKIQGNYIGTDVTGLTALPHASDGLHLVEDASANVIGTDGDGMNDAAEGNRIAFNLGHGINLVNAGSQRNTMRGNAIFSNGGLGIRDCCGANGAQALPVLTLAQAGATTRVVGNLNSTPNTTFTLDFYASAAADPSGYGEGQRYLGSTTVTTDAGGNASFSVILAAATTGGEFLSATATDSAGNTSEFSAVFQLPTNTPPTQPTLNGPFTVNENGTVTLTGSFSDPDTAQTHTVTITWGDGATSTLTLSPTANGQKSFTATHQYLDDGPSPGNGTPSDTYTITVTVNDGAGGTSSNSTTATVNNVAPSITGSSGPAVPMQAPATATVTVTFTDVGTQDRHTCAFTWDDGSSSPGTVSEANGSGTCTGTHPYATAGVYTVTFTVTDDDTGTAGGTLSHFIVVFNAAGGFVTGGGNSTSPVNPAYPYMQAGGTANFGFNARYRTDGTLQGQNEFNFREGGLNFHGTVNNYLVVAPNGRAQYQASGTVNGVGGYTATVTAWDDSTTSGCTGDRYRIQIVNSAGVVVYDNGSGTGDIDTCPPAIANGNLVVHSGALLSQGGPGGAQGAALTPEQLAPIVAAAVARWQAAGLDPAQADGLRQVAVRVVPLAGGTVGWSTAGAILLSPDAGGHGWFIDPTPADDREFGSERMAGGRLDLLTVVAHEMGHLLGLEHSPDGDGVMAESLPDGVRRMPRPQDLGFATPLGATNGFSLGVEKGINGVRPVETAWLGVRRGLLDGLFALTPQMPAPATEPVAPALMDSDAVVLIPGRPDTSFVGVVRRRASGNVAMMSGVSDAMDDGLLEELARNLAR